MFLYTFCVNIGRHNNHELIRSLKLLLSSLERHLENYKLICYTNIQPSIEKVIPPSQEVEYRAYYDKKPRKIYSHPWLNLSFNKINIYKDLRDETGIDYVWIDLDTIIAYDISYINDYPNVFLENGGTITKENVLFLNNNTITVPRNRYIQGNLWKINLELYKDLMNTLDELRRVKLHLRYDLQDLFNYYIYIKNNIKEKNIHILGRNVREKSLNGLAMWSSLGNTHATMDGLNHFYLEDGILKTRYYPEKEIHILSFTFYTLKQLYNSPRFREFFGS